MSDSKIFKNFKKPHMCISSKASSKCVEWVAQWSLGMDLDNFVEKQAGFRMGLNFKRIFYLQIHLNFNFQFKSILVDKIGFRVNYTNDLRAYLASSVQIGQESIQIEPGKSEVLVKGGCSHTCLKSLIQKSEIEKIYLTRVYLHMHELGVKGELIRVRRFSNGTIFEKKIVISQENYDYMKPKVFLYSNESLIDIQHGDELILNCYFNSKEGSRQKNKTVNFGLGAKVDLFN